MKAPRQNQVHFGQAVEHSGSSLGPVVKCHLGIVLVHNEAPERLKHSLEALGPQLERADARVVVVDNGSTDGSTDLISKYLNDAFGEGAGWKLRVNLVRSAQNRGTAGGINFGLSFFDSDFYLIVATGAQLHAGSLANLLQSAKAHPAAGVIAARIGERPPRLREVPIDRNTAFNTLSPLSEFFCAAQLIGVNKSAPFLLAKRKVRKIPVRADWVRFACALISRQAAEAVGPFDEEFFAYFEDADYCHRVRKAGFSVMCDPAAGVFVPSGTIITPVSGDETSLAKDRINASQHALMNGFDRELQHFYESRSLYFKKVFGPVGPLLANLGWALGRAIAQLVRLTQKTTIEEPVRTAANIWQHWR